MKELFTSLQRCLLAGEDCLLVSILADSGSAPRGVGAHMLVNAGGRLLGTIGGGAMEYRSCQLALELLAQRKSLLKEYHLSRDLGMICGGDATVFFQFIAAEDRSMQELCADALGLFAEDADIWLITGLAEDGSWRMGIAGREEISAGLGLSLSQLKPYLTSSPDSFTQEGITFYAEPVNSAGRVLIFGGGHVAQALTPVLAKLNFNCWIFDNRPEIADKSLFPQAKEVIFGEYEELSKYLQIRAEDYVVVMTHGHAADYVVQKQVMRHKTAYIGVIGSRNKVKTMTERLAGDGFSAAEIAAVHAPIGLPIKAETPDEIAISIAGELIKVRAEAMGR